MTDQLSRPRLRSLITAFWLLFLTFLPRLASGQEAAKPVADVVIFTNGDQLTGKLLRATGGTIAFHSDIAGDINIPADKIKELRSSGSFAVLKKNEPVVGALVRPGSVHIADGKLTLASGAATVDTVPISDLSYIIDEQTFRRETNPRPSIWYGWNGALSAGATLVRATQTETTLTAAANLVRQFPTVPYLPPRNRTTADLAETYGTSRTPGMIPQPAPPAAQVPDQVVKTSIFHADAEQDEYVSQRFYYLGDVAFDHNFSQGLQLQQIYGGGVGWTPLQRPKEQLDLKAEVHYEMQSFIQPVQPAAPAAPLPLIPTQELIGSTFAENYHYNFPRSIVFTENANVIPSWNNVNAYSANIFAGLALPVWKRFAANLTGTDNFLNNPPNGYKKNSFQFVTGISYTLH